MGQTLAQSKIMSIQNSFDLLATNIQEETKSLKEQAEVEKKSDKNASPVKMEQAVKGIEKKTQKIFTDLDTITNMEYELKEKGADVPPEEELNAIRKKIQDSVASANEYIKTYKQEVESKKKEAEAEKEEELGGKDPKNRS